MKASNFQRLASLTYLPRDLHHNSGVEIYHHPQAVPEDFFMEAANDPRSGAEQMAAANPSVGTESAVPFSLVRPTSAADQIFDQMRTAIVTDQQPSYSLFNLHGHQWAIIPQNDSNHDQVDAPQMRLDVHCQARALFLYEYLKTVSVEDASFGTTKRQVSIAGDPMRKVREFLVQECNAGHFDSPERMLERYPGSKKLIGDYTRQIAEADAVCACIMGRVEQLFASELPEHQLAAVRQVIEALPIRGDLQGPVNPLRPDRCVSEHEQQLYSQTLKRVCGVDRPVESAAPYSFLRFNEPELFNPIFRVYASPNLDVPGSHSEVLAAFVEALRKHGLDRSLDWKVAEGPSNRLDFLVAYVDESIPLPVLELALHDFAAAAGEALAPSPLPSLRPSGHRGIGFGMEPNDLNRLLLLAEMPPHSHNTLINGVFQEAYKSVQANCRRTGFKPDAAVIHEQAKSAFSMMLHVLGIDTLTMQEIEH